MRKKNKEGLEKALGITLVLALGVLLPRLAVVGGAPFMDDSSYVYEAMGVWRRWRDPSLALPLHEIMLYPRLLAPLCGLPGNTLLWFRLADLVMALLSAWLFCLVMIRLARSVFWGLALALPFAAAMNFHLVIDAGFKNSMTAAFAPLLAAWLLASDASLKNWKWAAAGALTALSVLLREPFIAFALIALAAAFSCGFRAGLYFSLGAFLCACAAFLLVGWSNGDLFAAARAYSQRGEVFSVQTYRIWPKFRLHGARFLFRYWTLILLCLFSVWAGRGALAKKKGKAAFWLAAALAPLAEPALKVGFLYHFASALPALGGLCALFWPTRKLSAASAPGGGAPPMRRIGGFFVFLALVQAAFNSPPLGAARDSLRALANIASGGWPADLVSQSPLLKTAEEVKILLPAGGSLSASGFNYMLYPVTKAMPPGAGSFDKDDLYRLSDLSRAYRGLGRDKERLARALKNNPPDVIVLSETLSEHEPDNFPDVYDSVERTGLYKLVKATEHDKRVFPWQNYYIFVKKPSNQP